MGIDGQRLPVPGLTVLKEVFRPVAAVQLPPLHPSADHLQPAAIQRRRAVMFLVAAARRPR